MVLLRQQINFLSMQPKILPKQPNFLLIEPNILLLLQNIFVIPILTNDFVGITKPFFRVNTVKNNSCLGNTYTYFGVKFKWVHVFSLVFR